jgi:hypothetical protein
MLPYRFYFIAEGFGGGAGRILLPAAELASLCLEEAVAGSNVVKVLRDHGHVQFFLRLVARCSSSFHRVGGLCLFLFLTVSFAGLVASACIRPLFQYGGAGELGGKPVCGVSCVTPVCGACCGR